MRKYLLPGAACPYTRDLKAIFVVPTRKAIRNITNTYPICQSPLKRSVRRCFSPLRKSRRNHRSICEQKPYLTTTLLALLACVTSVFNRVIARKVEPELKTNGRGKGRGEKETFFPLPSPVIPFFRVRTGHGKPTTTTATTTKLY